MITLLVSLLNMHFIFCYAFSNSFYINCIKLKTGKDSMPFYVLFPLDVCSIDMHHFHFL